MSVHPRSPPTSDVRSLRRLAPHCASPGPRWPTCPPATADAISVTDAARARCSDSRDAAAAPPPASLRQLTPHGVVDDCAIVYARRVSELAYEQSRQAQLTALQTQANDTRSIGQARSAVFSDNRISSWVVLVAVLVITGCGLTLSAIQFGIAARARPLTTGGGQPLGDNTAEGDLHNLQTTIHVGMDGVQTTSSVLGTTILVISLAFFISL